MTRALTVAALVLATAGAEARTDDPAETQAKVHFKRGVEDYTRGQYEAAVIEFQAGYRLKPLPLFLYNIGQAARMAGNKQLALDSYERYLQEETSADAPELTAARREIELIRSARPAPSETHGQPAVAPRVAIASPPSVAPPPPPRRPVWKRAALWVPLTVAAAAALAVGLGVGLSAQSPTSPSLGTLHF
jgi:hypothetical protein